MRFLSNIQPLALAMVLLGMLSSPVFAQQYDPGNSPPPAPWQGQQNGQSNGQWQQGQHPQWPGQNGQNGNGQWQQGQPGDHPHHHHHHHDQGQNGQNNGQWQQGQHDQDQQYGQYHPYGNPPQ